MVGTLNEMVMEQGNNSIKAPYQGVQSRETPKNEEMKISTKDNDRQRVTTYFAELSSGINSRGALRACAGAP